MAERREVDPDEITLHGTDPEKISVTGLEIDNGKFKISVDRSAFDTVCARKDIHAGMRDQLWQQIEAFNERVIAEKEKTEDAIGSTDPIAAIQSELWRLAETRADVPQFSSDEVKEFVTNLQ